MRPRRPTAIIVDDATFTRQSLPALMPELEFTAGFATAHELVAGGAVADMVILEVQRADKCPDEVRQGLLGVRLAAAVGHRVCVYTQEPRPFVHAACLAAGAKGVVSRAEPLAVTQQAFLEVARGGTIITGGLVEAFDLLPRRRQLAVVTARQRSILNARARRLDFAAIAELLGVESSVVLDEWRTASAAVGRFLQDACPQAATQDLGLTPDDLADIWPQPPPRPTCATGSSAGPLLTG